MLSNEGGCGSVMAEGSGGFPENLNQNGMAWHGIEAFLCWPMIGMALGFHM